MKKIAIIGTNGVPSKYGGFETLVEFLTKYLSKRYEITVFCSSITNINKISEFNGCKLKYIPLKANGPQAILYDCISIIQSCRSYDKILILGQSGTIILPLLKKYRNKFIINFGGLDWERSKWGYFTRKFIKLSESFGIKYSDHIISDNLGIQDYIKTKYLRESNLITYGGNQVFYVAPNSMDIIKYPFLTENYAFSVARIQADNNIEMLLEAFNENSPYPFILVGNWVKSSFGIKTKLRYSNSPNLILLDAIYDQRELNLLRSNCKIYLHGHSAGGTNPALVEAMYLKLPIFAFDNIFNRSTTNYQAEYFSNSNELSLKINSTSENNLNEIGNNMYLFAINSYKWERIAEMYSQIFDL